MTEVINIKTYESNDYAYCGRGSIFGNPYDQGTREENIRNYKKWFNFLLRDERFVRELIKLKNRKIGCFCKPLDCHCDIIKEYLDNYDEI